MQGNAIDIWTGSLVLPTRTLWVSPSVPGVSERVSVGVFLLAVEVFRGSCTTVVSVILLPAKHWFDPFTIDKESCWQIDRQRVALAINDAN